MNEQRETDLGLVDDANDIESGMNDWEVEFVESLNRYLEMHATLTELQRNKLKQILNEKG